MMWMLSASRTRRWSDMCAHDGRKSESDDAGITAHTDATKPLHLDMTDQPRAERNADRETWHDRRHQQKRVASEQSAVPVGERREGRLGEPNEPERRPEVAPGVPLVIE